MNDRFSWFSNFHSFLYISTFFFTSIYWILLKLQFTKNNSTQSELMEQKYDDNHDESEQVTSSMESELSSDRTLNQNVTRCGVKEKEIQNHIVELYPNFQSNSIFSLSKQLNRRYGHNEEEDEKLIHPSLSASTSPPSPSLLWTMHTPSTFKSISHDASLESEPSTPLSLSKSTAWGDEQTQASISSASDQCSIDKELQRRQIITDSAADVEEKVLFTTQLRQTTFHHSDVIQDIRQIGSWVKSCYSFENVHPRRTRDQRKERRRVERRLAWIDLEEYSKVIFNTRQIHTAKEGHQTVKESFWISHCSFPIGYESCKAKTMQQDPILVPTSIWLQQHNRIKKGLTNGLGQDRMATPIALAVRKKAIDCISIRAEHPVGTKPSSSIQNSSIQYEKEEKIPSQSQETVKNKEMKDDSHTLDLRSSVAWAQDELYRMENPIWKYNYDNFWLQSMQSIENDEKAAISQFFVSSANQWYDNPTANLDVESFLQSDPVSDDYQGLSSGEMAEIEEELLRQQQQTLVEPDQEVNYERPHIIQPLPSKPICSEYLTDSASQDEEEGDVTEIQHPFIDSQKQDGFYKLEMSSSVRSEASFNDRGNHLDSENANIFPSSPSIITTAIPEKEENEENNPQKTKKVPNGSELRTAQEENEILRLRVIELQKHLSLVASEQQQQRFDTLRVMEEQLKAIASLEELHWRHSQALAQRMQIPSQGNQMYREYVSNQDCSLNGGYWNTTNSVVDGRSQVNSKNQQRGECSPTKSDYSISEDKAALECKHSPSKACDILAPNHAKIPKFSLTDTRFLHPMANTRIQHQTLNERIRSSGMAVASSSILFHESVTCPSKSEISKPFERAENRTYLTPVTMKKANSLTNDQQKVYTPKNWNQKMTPIQPVSIKESSSLTFQASSPVSSSQQSQNFGDKLFHQSSSSETNRVNNNKNNRQQGNWKNCNDGERKNSQQQNVRKTNQYNHHQNHQRRQGKDNQQVIAHSLSSPLVKPDRRAYAQ